MAVSRLRHCTVFAKHQRDIARLQTQIKKDGLPLHFDLHLGSYGWPWEHDLNLTRELSQCGPSLLHSPPSPTSDPVEGTESQWVKKPHNLRATFILQRSRGDLLKPPPLECCATFQLPNVSKQIRGQHPAPFFNKHLVCLAYPLANKDCRRIRGFRACHPKCSVKAWLQMQRPWISLMIAAL